MRPQTEYRQEPTACSRPLALRPERALVLLDAAITGCSSFMEPNTCQVVNDYLLPPSWLRAGTLTRSATAAVRAQLCESLLAASCLCRRFCRPVMSPAAVLRRAV